MQYLADVHETAAGQVPTAWAGMGNRLAVQARPFHDRATGAASSAEVNARPIAMQKPSVGQETASRVTCGIAAAGLETNDRAAAADAVAPASIRLVIASATTEAGRQRRKRLRSRARDARAALAGTASGRLVRFMCATLRGGRHLAA
jgi:hypothetical protein